MLVLAIFKIFPLQKFYAFCSYIRFNREYGYMNWNLVPFRTITEHFSFMNVCGNVFSFIPFGFYAFRFFESNVVKTLLASELFILIVQVLRFVTMIGFFDVDDFIRYTAGIAIGMLCAKFYDAKLSKIKLSVSIEAKN
ncbi:MAG: VanZ family protein [Oscillospiraceae bacterium]|nr:VanZ family protein [Oscillospiraceae bacterium]